MKKPLILAAFAAAFAFTSAAAGDADLSAEVAACRAETDSLKRLICYDAISIDTEGLEGQALGPIATYEGAGMASTRPFVAPGAFVVQVQGGGAGLSVMVRDPDTGFPESVVSGSPGETYVPKGGRYFLEVMAFGPWRATVIPAE